MRAGGVCASILSTGSRASFEGWRLLPDLSRYRTSVICVTDCALREHLISSQFFFLNVIHFETGVGVTLAADGKSYIPQFQNKKGNEENFESRIERKHLPAVPLLITRLVCCARRSTVPEPVRSSQSDPGHVWAWPGTHQLVVRGVLVQ